MINTKNIFVQFPTIKLKNDIVLREINPKEDAIDYFKYMTKKEVANFIASASRPKSLSHSILELEYWSGLFKSKYSFYWGIEDRTHNKLIGTIGFNSIHQIHRKAEVSYDLSYYYWGKGIMTEAMVEILNFAKKIGLIRIQATTLTTNTRSQILLERTGYKLEGILKKYEFFEGKNRDSYMYAITL